MSTLIAAYTFNELAAHDYSGNKYHLTNNGGTFAATTSTVGVGNDLTLGSVGSPDIHTTSFATLSAYTGLSIFSYFKYSLHDNYLFENSALSIYVSATDKIVFKIVTTGGTYTLTSTATLTTATWYALACVWDGAKLYIYINGTLDSSLSTTGTMTAGDNTLYVRLESTINTLEIRSTALTADNVSALGASPGGINYQVSNHNFAVGDLIADSSVTAQAVVTWVVDDSNIIVYPFTAAQPGALFRYGNIYNTNRQSCFEINNDFDGNTNAQVSIKYPIASFADYTSPANSQTWDYTGFVGMPSPQTKTMISYRI